MKGDFYEHSVCCWCFLRCIFCWYGDDDHSRLSEVIVSYISAYSRGTALPFLFFHLAAKAKKKDMTQGHVLSVSKKYFRPAVQVFRTQKSSKNFLFEQCRTPFLGFPHTPFLPIKSDNRVYRQSQQAGLLSRLLLYSSIFLRCLAFSSASTSAYAILQMMFFMVRSSASPSR